VPVWHASVSCIAYPGHRFRDLPERMRLEALRLAERALALVGEGETQREEMGGIAAHVRRCLSAAELRTIDPAFLACPAVDSAGVGTPL
jgi:hypothetical protein